MSASRNTAFDAEVTRGFDFYLSLAPEVATFCGVTTHDHRLPPANKEALVARVEMLGDWARTLGAFEGRTLAPDQALDALTLPKIHALHRFGLEELRVADTQPDALGDAGNLFFMATFSDYDSEEHRWENIAGRLEQLPSYLAQFRARVTKPEPRWSRIAAEVGASFPQLLEALVAQSAKAAPAPAAKRVEKAAAVAGEAGVTHTAWARKHAGGTERWAIGAEKFEALLKLKGIPLAAREVEEIGERQLRELTEERDRLAEAIAPGDGQAQPPFARAMAKLKEDRPASFAEALATVERLVADSRKKVIDDGIAAIPPGERLDVIETPEFMRPLTPFAAIFPSMKFAKVQRGIYVVTPPPPGDSLAETHHADLHNVVCHEGYPGHHLQLATANLRTSPIRSVDLGGFPSSGGTTYAIDLVEGWAHYCELLMKEHGFHDTPGDRLVLVNDALWRAARVVLDVRLHAGRISADEAIRFLHEKTGMSVPGATSEVNRYTMTPTYQLSYCIGKHLLLQLKEEHRNAAATGWTERAFHDTVLSAGCIPVADIRNAWRAGLLTAA